MLLSYLLLTGISNICAFHHPDGWNYKECPPEQETCEFWLYIQEKLTMIYHKDLVYADKGKLYLYNEHPSNYSTEVSKNSIILAKILLFF